MICAGISKCMCEMGAASARLMPDVVLMETGKEKTEYFESPASSDQLPPRRLDVATDITDSLLLLFRYGRLENNMDCRDGKIDCERCNKDPVVVLMEIASSSEVDSVDLS